MDPKKKDIKLFGSVFSMAADGQAAYAQQIWDDVKKMFITDSRWINLPDEYKNAVYELATKEGDPNITFSDKFDSLQTAISAIPKFAIKVVDELPSSDISSTTVYLKKTSETETGNLYTEYIYINNKWEQLGTQKLDLSDYAKTSEVNTELDKKVDKETGKGLSTNDYTNDEKTKLSGIAEGAEVNVQSDWQQTIETADDYIKNKPDLFSQNIYKTDDIPASGGDDVARVILGGDWRMPTYEEYMELINNCQYEWTQINGVSGAKLIGSNNNYIFIPADCEFWCSSLEPRSILQAYTSYLTSSEKAWSSRARIYGEHIRPVSETEGIDLGLSVKWSDRNLGAVSIEQVGDAYAWGETEIKTNYSWENYKFGSYDNLTKYNSTDGLTVLDLGSPAQEGEEFLAKTYYNSDGKLTKIVPKEGDVIIPKYIEEYKNEIYTLAIEFDENLIPFSGPPFLVHNMTKNMSNAVIPYGYITSLNGPNNTKYLSLCWQSAAGPSTYQYFLPKSYIEAKGLSLTPNKWYTSYDNTAKEVECIGKGLEWIHTNYAEQYNPDNYEEIAENIRKAINGITEQLTFEEKFEKVNTKINTKQDKLIEGNNISIEDNEISAIIPDIPTLPEEYQNEPYIFGFTYDLLPNNTAPAIVYNYSKDMQILNTPYAYILRSGSSEGYYLQLCWYDGTSYTYQYYLTQEFIQYIGASLTSNKWYNSTSSSAQEVECLGKNLEWIHTSYLESANPDNYEEVAKNLIAAVNGKNENVTIKEKFDSLSVVANTGDYDDLLNLPKEYKDKNYIYEYWNWDTIMPTNNHFFALGFNVSWNSSGEVIGALDNLKPYAFIEVTPCYNKYPQIRYYCSTTSQLYYLYPNAWCSETSISKANMWMDPSNNYAEVTPTLLEGTYSISTQLQEVYPDTYEYVAEQLYKLLSKSFKEVTFKNKFTDIDNKKQDKLTEGFGIDINNNVINSEVKCIPSQQSQTWEEVEWEGYSYSIFGGNTWKDYSGTIHHDNYRYHIKLLSDNITWQSVSYIGLENSEGSYIWKDYNGTIYYSDGDSTQYKLLDDNITWQQVTWQGDYTSIFGSNIWKDYAGVIHYDASNKHYKLLKDCKTWKEVTYTGLATISGLYIWKDYDGIIHYDKGNEHYKLLKDNTTWVSVVWSGDINTVRGLYIWKDYNGVIHYDYEDEDEYEDSQHYKLLDDNITWQKVTWANNTHISGQEIWEDYKNIIHCSGFSGSHKLLGNVKGYYTKHEDELQEKLIAGNNITIDNNIISANVPNKVSDLENDSGYAKSTDLSTVATSGDYDDLENLPDLFSQDYIINYKVDDAATAAWGPDWRMPTVEECKELVNSCKFTQIIIDGVNGYKVESKKEGNTNWIFLPAAGYRRGSDVSDAGDNGYYWSSSLYSYQSIAYVLFFNNDEIKGNNGVDRYRGGSVRAVSETKGIDLGLTSGIKWADRNIGSETITGYGNYFAWGEIETKTDYSWETYKYGTSSNITKYNKTDGLTILERTKEVLAQVYYNEKGKVSKIIDEEGVETIPEDTKQEVLTAGEGIEISEDNVISTTPLDHLVHYGCDDAARYLLGSDWKTPTKANFEELVANCTATWENVWGNWGYRFTSTTNDASIFLPVTGYYIGANNTSSTTTGWYWTNEKVNDSDASCLIFGDVYISTEGRTGKCFGMPIRPVSLSQGVDLGLPSGIKWASSNLTLKGLAEREDIKGDYFAWAEYDTKSDYNTYSYKWYIAETGTYTKYNTVDGLSTLTLESYIDESTKHQEFAKKSDLASVAFSGDYEDLINKYSIKVLTQSEYNSIVKDNNTLYFIKS